MDTNSILILVNMILTVISPIIVSMAYMIKNIRKSACCGASMESKPSSPALNVEKEV